MQDFTDTLSSTKDLWRKTETHRESLSIPLEILPPYCNFLFESYLEQPETALQ